ncbi:hypothetical protein GP486_001191 [Trichoglossum hirsutum]|uniref:Queuosine 5'-phosphate N-glycosylase/hydrolase n=1 Tax=Trichoglossum hirsutum TaxID=265104 RepID=A0A9P8LHD3_9PEZI|nr:hypothetical protein GP486_001191 [Trichoglossum hirsutum]
MSDDEADPDLLALLRQSLGLSLTGQKDTPAETKVLEGARHIYDNSIDVAIDSQGTRAAAESIWTSMCRKEYSTKTWSTHELHPKAKNEDTINLIFTIDLLNFSFWSESELDQRFAVHYRDKNWTGYWSLVAALQRALDEDIPITSSDFWQSEDECSKDLVRWVFRSATNEEIPLFDERLACLREAGRVLYERFNCRFLNCINEASGSAAALVNLLVENFPCFNDEAGFEGRNVRFYKRAQILVADLWACFEGEGYGKFRDINEITMFADYRIPQILHNLGCLRYSPPLENHIRQLKLISEGHTWEVELRGSMIPSNSLKTHIDLSHRLQYLVRGADKDPDSPATSRSQCERGPNRLLSL